jgi:hypothetical protein
VPIARARFACLSTLATLAIASAAGCKASPTERGFVGQSGLCEGDAGPRCEVAPTPANRGPSAGCGKAVTQAPGQYARFSLNIACEADNARDRLYYVRLPPNYDPNRAYRTVYLGPGCGPPQDSTPGVAKTYPLQTASDPDAILIAMEQGFYNKAEYNRNDCTDSPDAGASLLCHYCFDDGAGTTSTDSAEYGYFDRLHKQIEADYCVDTSKQFYAGYSSGGWMAHQLGCRFSDVLRAQGSVTGGLPPAIRNCEASCVNHPIAAFLIHDSADPSNPYSGSIAALERLLVLNRCEGGTTMATAPSVPYTIADHPNTATFKCLQYTGCPAEYPIVFCTSNGFSHDSQTAVAVPGFWQFFKSL